VVSRWLFPPLRSGVRDRVDMWDFVVDKVAPGQVSSEYFGFPCQIHSANCSKRSYSSSSSSSIIGDMYNRPNGQTSVAAVQGPNRHLGTQDHPRQTDRQTDKGGVEPFPSKSFPIIHYHKIIRRNTKQRLSFWQLLQRIEITENSQLHSLSFCVRDNVASAWLLS
jgi:hypothetical protein